jgi:hypothetical protein
MLVTAVGDELRLTGALPRQRFVATLAVLALAPTASVLPALVTWTLVYGILGGCGGGVRRGRSIRGDGPAASGDA